MAVTVLLVAVLAYAGAVLGGNNCNSMDYLTNVFWSDWAVNNITNLQFASSKWKFADFHEYIVQVVFICATTRT